MKKSKKKHLWWVIPLILLSIVLIIWHLNLLSQYSATSFCKYFGYENGKIVAYGTGDTDTIQILCSKDKDNINLEFGLMGFFDQEGNYNPIKNIPPPIND